MHKDSNSYSNQFNTTNTMFVAEAVPFAYADGLSAILVFVDDQDTIRRNDPPVMCFRSSEIDGGRQADGACSTMAASSSSTPCTYDDAAGRSSNGQVACRCKYSHCLKLYCECLAAAKACNEACKCLGCQNLGNAVGVRKRLVRNINLLAGIPVVCRCRRTKCVKKYCDCYKSGVACSLGCKCMECSNKVNGLRGSAYSQFQNSLRTPTV